jgi:hypothetical protein
VRRFGPIRGNLEGLLPRILRDFGFDNVAEGGRVTTLFGTLVVVSGRGETDRTAPLPRQCGAEVSAAPVKLDPADSPG